MNHFTIKWTIIASVIFGTILDNKTNEPLTGVHIKTSDKTIYSDFNGKFTIETKDSIILELISYQDTTIHIPRF